MPDLRRTEKWVATQVWMPAEMKKRLDMYLRSKVAELAVANGMDRSLAHSYASQKKRRSGQQSLVICQAIKEFLEKREK